MQRSTAVKTLTGFFTSFCLTSSIALAGTLAEPEFLNVDVWPKARNAGPLNEIIEDSRGYLWATTKFGVYRYDGYTVKGYFNSIEPASLSSSFAEALFMDSNGDLWIGSADGLNRYRYATDDFERLSLDGVSGDRIYRIYEDAQKDLWLGTGAGLVHIDRQNREKELYVPAEWKGHSVHAIRAIAEDRDDADIMWAGGILGLFSLDKTTGEMQHYPMPYSNKKGWEPMINQMYLDEAGIMWCATWGVYILSYNTRTGEWNQYTTGRTNASYQDSVIFDIQFRDEYSLWVANGSGVGIFNKATGTYVLYEHEPGNARSLAASHAYYGVCITRGGNLAVAGQSAISISSPVVSPPPGIQFPPVISRIAIGDTQAYTDSPVTELRRITLEDDQKDLSLTLRLPGAYFSDPTFSYQLEGYDRDWKSLAQGSNAIRYTNLPKGDYVLRYRASIDGEHWEEGSPLAIGKEVFFWKTPAFYLAVGLFMTGILLLLYFLRIRFIRREAALKTEFDKKIANIEMAALRAQMNPHFLFNSMNSIKYFILNEEPGLANKYLTKFSRLMRMVLRNTESQFVSLAEEVEALRLYIEMESLRLNSGFEYQIDIDADLNQDEILVPPLIIQPYVENAIWHGLRRKKDPGHLYVGIHQKESHLTIVVEDDGIGREAAMAARNKPAARKSFGTRIAKDRIALVSETLGMRALVRITDLKQDNQPAGTRVFVEIPIIDQSMVSIEEHESNLDR